MAETGFSRVSVGSQGWGGGGMDGKVRGKDAYISAHKNLQPVSQVTPTLTGKMLS